MNNEKETVVVEEFYWINDTDLCIVGKDGSKRILKGCYPMSLKYENIDHSLTEEVTLISGKRWNKAYEKEQE